MRARSTPWDLQGRRELRALDRQRSRHPRTGQPSAVLDRRRQASTVMIQEQGGTYRASWARCAVSGARFRSSRCQNRCWWRGEIPSRVVRAMMGPREHTTRNRGKREDMSGTRETIEDRRTRRLGLGSENARRSGPPRCCTLGSRCPAQPRSWRTAGPAMRTAARSDAAP